jgi:hypothetical protein
MHNIIEFALENNAYKLYNANKIVQQRIVIKIIKINYHIDIYKF